MSTLKIIPTHNLSTNTGTSTSKGTDTSGSSAVFTPLFPAPEKTVSSTQSEPLTLTRSVLVSEPNLTINREPSTTSNLSVSQLAPNVAINRDPYASSLRVAQGSSGLTINRETSSSTGSQDADSTDIAALLAAFGRGAQTGPADLDRGVDVDPSRRTADSDVADIDASNISVDTGVPDEIIYRPAEDPPPAPVTYEEGKPNQQTQKQESATPAETSDYLPWIAVGVAGLAVVGAVVYTMRQRKKV